MKAVARTAKTHRIELIEAELAEQCARVVRLLQRLAKEDQGAGRERFAR